MANCDPAGFVVNVQHPEIMCSIPGKILALVTSVGRGAFARTVLAVVVDDWLFDELAAFGGAMRTASRSPMKWMKHDGANCA